MAKIIFTEAQFKGYLRHVLQEKRSTDYAKDIINEEIKKKENPAKK